MGEQLTISYLDQSMGVQQRREHLRWAYGFVCTCSLCRHQAGEE